MSEAVIVSAVRTAIGNFGGTISTIPVSKLGAIVVKAALKKAGLRPKRDPEVLCFTPECLQDAGLTELEKKYSDWDNALTEVRVDEVIMGHVLQAGQGQNTARQSLIFGGIPKETNAFTVNKVCASGMKAIALGAQAIRTGDAEVIIAGGMESMSTVPYYFPKARWGARMFNAEMVDGMVFDGLWEGFYNYHMGLTAENIAEKLGITRAMQDELAVMSNLRAIAAIKNGIFKDEVVPVEYKDKKETKLFDTDEHPRETSVEALAKLGPAFKPTGTITAGNASAITDGAAAVLLMSAEKARKLGLKPLATVRAYSAGGVDPAYMGLGACPATRRALKMAGLELKDINTFELNEAFAAQSLGVMKELKLRADNVNPYGSGISLGHPLGCTGARIVVTLLHEMKRKSFKTGLAALCIGGGQGMAIALERK